MKAIGFWLILFAATASQGAVQPPTKAELLKAFRDADYVLKQFDNVTGKLHFSRWHVPEGMMNGSTELFERTKKERATAGENLGRFYSADYVSSFDLLELMWAVEDVGNELDRLGSGVLTFQDKDDDDLEVVSETLALGTDLSATANSAHLASNGLYTLIRKLVLVEQQALISCQKKESSTKLNRK